MPLDPATLRPLPSMPAQSGVLESLAFFRDPDFARSRFVRYGDVYETSLLGQRTVVIRGHLAAVRRRCAPLPQHGPEEPWSAINISLH